MTFYSLSLVSNELTANDTFLEISGSKSETNRLLILQALYPTISLKNIATADDTLVLQQALSQITNKKEVNTIDIHNAGTAMRFLTAFLATQYQEEVILTGSSRMKERPIQILVDALKQIGATILYLEKEGFPPLKITGTISHLQSVKLNANVSSQYITALLLVAPKLPLGLEINLMGTITSRPYIELTLKMLEELSINTSFEKNVITVKPKKAINETCITIESDWSSASYWYAIVAFSPINTTITLSSFKKDSKQGDAIVATYFKDFGVETAFTTANKVILTKTKHHIVTTQTYHLIDTPDLAQTLAVTCLGLGISCTLTGIHTLKIKETDRIVALKNEIEKFSTTVTITNDSLQFIAPQKLAPNQIINTYNDHRMALAFATLALKTPIIIENPLVVSKSYPNFWNDLKKIGVAIQQVN